MEFLLLTGTLLWALIGQTAFGSNNCQVDIFTSPGGNTYCYLSKVPNFPKVYHLNFHKTVPA
jgi:hypothetical protein